VLPLFGSQHSVLRIRAGWWPSLRLGTLRNAMGFLKVKYRFRVLCLAVCIAANASCLFARAESPFNLFDFHSGFWNNLHHFLCRQALLSQPQKGPHSLALTGADSDELQHLSPTERESWNAAVAYYAGSFAKRDLLFDEGLITTKGKLEDAEASPDLRKGGRATPSGLSVTLPLPD
jgi:hypothetical protein